MCGIAGFMIVDKDRELGLNAEAMTAVLAYEMKARGRDATGILTVDRRGKVKLRKEPRPADLFLARREGIGSGAQTCLIHTRAATQGSPDDNRNNHPIRYGRIIGVHNGVLHNDDALYDHYDWERLGKVDSEAIFAALHHLPIDDALVNIDGSWAIGWIDVNDDPRRLWLARGNSSPLCYAMTANGSVVFASTASAVKEAFKAGGVRGEPHVETAPEGFLAHTNPDDGGLIYLPEFDGSGEKAIGARRRYVSSVYGWSGHGGYDWYNDSAGLEEWEIAARKRRDAERTKSLPRTALPATTPPLRTYERHQETGDPAHPKVNDRRYYFDADGNKITEICSKVEKDLTTWRQLSIQIAAREPDKADDDVAQVTVPAESEDRDPFDDLLDDLEGDWRYSYPEVGDVIELDARMFGGSPDQGVRGQVTGVDPITGELDVEWRPSRLDMTASYDVLIKAQKGA